MLSAVVVWIVVITPVRAFDLEVSEAGAHVRWYTPEVTLQLDAELEAFFNDLPLMALTRDAAAAWSGVNGAPALQIIDGAAPAPGFQDGQNFNAIYLAHDWLFERDALATTVVSFDSKSGRLMDADVFINANFEFAWIADDGKDRKHYDLLAVMTHELGHVLGLADSMNVPEATMSPYFKRGDTHQRDLAEDDEQGLAATYADANSEETASQAGCGGASVLRARAVSPVGRSQIVAASLVVLALWLCSRRRAQYALVFGAALLFGAPPAPRATTAHAALAAAAQPPSRWLSAEHPQARQRLAAFTRGAQQMIEGRAAQRRAHRRAGLIWTRFVVEGASGAVELELPGGSLDGVTQTVSGHALPAEGDQLLIARRAQGPHAWAQLRDGLAFGGTLGSGPALRWR